MDIRVKMQKAKGIYRKLAGLTGPEMRNLKWVDGSLHYKGTDTEFTVNQLLESEV